MLLKKIYDIIMWCSVFLAYMGLYCKITISYVKDSFVGVFFVVGLILSLFMSLFLRNLLQYYCELHSK